MVWNEDIKAEILKEINNMSWLYSKRFGIKITLYKSIGKSSDNEVVYYNKGFRFEAFMRWRWFFRYRGALEQLKHPKYFVEIEQFSYDVSIEKEDIEKRVRDIIKARKAKLTIAKNKLSEYRKNYRSLFPIEEDKNFIKYVEVIKKYEDRLLEAEADWFIPNKVKW